MFIIILLIWPLLLTIVLLKAALCILRLKLNIQENIRLIVNFIVSHAQPMQRHAIYKTDRFDYYKAGMSGGKTHYLLLDYLKHMVESIKPYNGVIVSEHYRDISDIKRCDSLYIKLGGSFDNRRKRWVFNHNGSYLFLVQPWRFFENSQGLVLSWCGIETEGEDDKIYSLMIDVRSHRRYQLWNAIKRQALCNPRTKRIRITRPMYGRPMYSRPNSGIGEKSGV